MARRHAALAEWKQGPVPKAISGRLRGRDAMNTSSRRRLKTVKDRTTIRTSWMSGCSMVRGSKRGTIGTRKRRSWGSNCISKGFAQAIEHRNTGLVGRLPSTRFFLLEKLNLPSPVRTAATPKMEGEAVLLAGEGTQFRDVKPNPLGRNQELEGAIMQEGNMKMRGRAANGGLEDGAHRG